MYSSNYLLLNAVTNALWLLGWLYIVLNISVITHRCQCRCVFTFDTNKNLDMSSSLEDQSFIHVTPKMCSGQIFDET